MVKQLVIIAMFHFIQNALDAIQFTWAIFDFTILAQYISYINKMLWYMEHALYKPKKIRITLKHYWPIELKLCWPTFNKLKFYAITHFAQYIWDYDSVIQIMIKFIAKQLINTFYKLFTIKLIKKSGMYKSSNITYVIQM